jgi:hypothetical protein
MAEILKLLGNTYIMCGRPMRNESLLYDALVEPLLHRTTSNRSCIDMMKQAGLKRIMNELSDDKSWPERPKSIGQFEKISLRELKTAAQMDYLACRRAVAAKALRSGKYVKSSELLQLGRSMKEMSKKFKELWLLRNKTSRLNDNLELFEQVEQESYRLAGEKKKL